MKIKETSLPDLHVIDFFHAGDDRGHFVKPFHKADFEANGLTSNLEESFYSVNSKNVVRGMHFQLPPHDHTKVVYCNHGSLLDVVVDLRKGSPTYGQYEVIPLTGQNYRGVYIPSGFAHGFEVLEDNTIMTYLTSTMHAPSHDGGIHMNSFGYKWGAESPITSERDKNFKSLDEFDSPFIFED